MDLRSILGFVSGALRAPALTTALGLSKTVKDATGVNTDAVEIKLRKIEIEKHNRRIVEPSFQQSIYLDAKTSKIIRKIEREFGSHLPMIWLCALWLYAVYLIACMGHRLRTQTARLIPAAPFPFLRFPYEISTRTEQQITVFMSDSRFLSDRSRRIFDGRARRLVSCQAWPIRNISRSWRKGLRLGILGGIATSMWSPI